MSYMAMALYGHKVSINSARALRTNPPKDALSSLFLVRTVELGGRAFVGAALPGVEEQLLYHQPLNSVSGAPKGKPLAACELTCGLRLLEVVKLIRSKPHGQVLRAIQPRQTLFAEPEADIEKLAVTHSGTNPVDYRSNGRFSELRVGVR